MDSCFEAIDIQLHNSCQKTISKFDSLQLQLSDEEKTKYKAKIQYTRSFIAYHDRQYDLSLELADSALNHFLWTKNPTWEAKTLFLIGTNSEAMILHEEALEAYQLCTQITLDTQLLCLSWIGIARSQKRLGLDWNDAYNKSSYYATKSKVYRLKLLIKLAQFRFTPEIKDYELRLNQIAKEYASLELYDKVANTNKITAVLKRVNGDYNGAISYIDKAIAIYENHLDNQNIYLASMYASKGSLLFKLEKKEEGKKLFLQAIAIHDSMGYSQNNYSIYKFLSRRDELSGDKSSALEMLQNAEQCQQTLTHLRIKRIRKLTSLFYNRESIITELAIYERKQRMRTIIITFLSIIGFLLSLYYINQYRKTNIQSKKQVEGLKKDRNKLLDDTGDLLMKVNTKQLSKEIENSLLPFQRKIEEYVETKQNAPQELKERYTEVMLSFKDRLPILTESEKRYATLIVLNVPSKHIAELLNVKLESVKRNRNFIRRKLGIANSSESLKDTLNTFL